MALSSVTLANRRTSRIQMDIYMDPLSDGTLLEWHESTSNYLMQLYRSDDHAFKELARSVLGRRSKGDSNIDGAWLAQHVTARMCGSGTLKIREIGSRLD